MPLPTLPEFTAPEVAALYWAVFAPPLLTGIRLSDDATVTDPAICMTPERQRWLAAMDTDPTDLKNYLITHCRSPRIGLVFEALWHFFLERDPETDLLAHNLAVRSEGRTIGEFDVIYFCHRQDQVVHLELAVKYYLRHPAGKTNDHKESAWHGPELRDRLDIKLARLRTHQLALTEMPGAAEALAGLAPATRIGQVSARIQGMLFGRVDDALAPANLHPAHSRGGLLTLSQFEQHSHTFDNFGILEKPDWLNATSAMPQPTALNRICTAVTDRPQLVIADTGGQRHVLMVTEDNWGH